MAKDVSFDPKEPEDLRYRDEETSPYGFEGDGREISPGATADEIFNGLKEKYAKGGFEEGPAPDLKTMPQIGPAEEAARNMEKLIHDQL